MKSIFLAFLVSILMTACGSNEDSQPGQVDNTSIITNISPSSGSIFGGTAVRINGLFFQKDAKVYFGSAVLKFMYPASYVHYVSAVELIAVSPFFFPGKVDIIVENPGADLGIRIGSFTYVNPPTDPVPNPNALPSVADTIGVVYSEANYFELLPAGEESNLNISFQFAYSRMCRFGNAFVPLAGKFNGASDPSGRSDTVGFYDQRSRQFRLKYSNTPGEADVVVNFGTKTALAVAGDFNGDGVDTIGTFENSTGEFQLKNSNTDGAADIVFRFGPTGLWVGPIVGDWNGDGIDTVGVIDALTRTVHLRNSNLAGPADITFQYSDLNLAPVVGDWNNDGRDTISFFDFTNFQLLIKNSLDGGLPDRAVRVKTTSSRITPIAGRWKFGSSSNYTGYPWPTATPASQGIDPANVEAAVSQLAQVPSSRSLLIIRNGRLVREAYFHGARADVAYDVKSVSKSFLSALWGIAYRDRVFPNILEPVSTYVGNKFPVNPDPRLYQITLLHMLTMSADLKWDEQSKEAGNLYWMTDDWTKSMFAFSFDADPGEKFVYNTGNTHVMAQILADKVGDLGPYAQQQLFNPLGIKAVRWDSDPQGYKIGGAEMFFVPRDMARLGQLYLNRGNMNGVQIIPPEWVDFTTARLLEVGDGRGYGGWWWMYKIGNYDAYCALGWGGQYVCNINALNMTIVGTAMNDVTSEQEGFNDAFFFKILGDTLLPGVTP